MTLLFSSQQYLAAAEAVLRGIERRIDAGLNPDVASVASVFISRWDVAVAHNVSPDLRNHLGIAMGKRIHFAYQSVLASDRWLRVLNFGARPQRLLWASTGTKDATASDSLYVAALAAPLTINTMPEATLNAFADHGELNGGLRLDASHGESVLAQFGNRGIDLNAMAIKLQDEGAGAFVDAWKSLMTVIASKCAELKKAS